MKSLLLVLLSLCSPIPAQESADYVDVVAPYPRRAANDRRYYLILKKLFGIQKIRPIEPV